MCQLRRVNYLVRHLFNMLWTLHIPIKTFGSLLDVDTFCVINLDEYRKLRLCGAPQAIPSMCVLVIKMDEHGQPDRAKSCIVVLGNLEERSWGKHERAAPVLKYSSLRLMVSAAIERRRKLKQADYKKCILQFKSTGR